MAVSPGLTAAIQDLSTREVILVASDFDGVLAPFVQDPLDARAIEGTLEDLVDLAALPRTHTAVVSGRELAVLTQLTGLAPDGAVTRIGTHGAQSSRVVTPELDESQRSLLATLTTELQATLEDHPGTRVEAKPTAVVLHTRGAEAERAAAATSAALEVAGRHTGVNVLKGKDVVELGVVHADKGTALMALATDVGADAVAYFGDDVTDEFAFEAMGDGAVSVKVGPGDTRAHYRVEGPQDVQALLRMLRERRTVAVGVAG